MSGGAMIGGFCVVIYLGHIPLSLMVLAIQAVMTREMFQLARSKASLGVNFDESEEAGKLPGFRKQQWFLVFTATFYMYGSLLRNHFIEGIQANPNQLHNALYFVLSHHDLICFSLYCLGIIAFVLSLKKGWFKYQFSQYAWTNMIIIFIVTQTSFFVANLFQGLIWFLLPVTLVICNDIMAFFSGFFMGRTPLLKISPKKTWEGFIGGGILTVLAAVPLARLLCRYSWMTCPRRDLSLGWLNCEPSLTFTQDWQSLESLFKEATGRSLKGMVEGFGWEALVNALESPFMTAPIDKHAIVLALFASAIAPFAGFFASGFKRAMKIKDFGESIPGHGGLTDRMDCQCLMGLFAFLYYRNCVMEHEVLLADAMDSVLALSSDDQLALFTRLGYVLVGKQMLPNSTVAELGRIPAI
eukprot:CAMPEP_0119154860 /NCGR_PEP_ID=MMETSP1310-20130426/51377_1 /TAXON_ID=464262 /ORGANISM="Genus nov. species nov., Strain RCC2339" /LENGTH=412 /DNA_ID=CAMNT_0007147429 /DNA_START=27 /DNA_END=1262 /DNA_ORIENTATION=+